MMVSSNIPLHKVYTPSFRNFFEKYTTHPIPIESTLIKNYLTSCYNDTINKIRNSVGNNKIRVSIDETTDVSGRFVANVVVGILNSCGCPIVCGELGVSSCLRPTVCLIVYDAETQKLGFVYTRWAAERQDIFFHFVFFLYFTAHVM